MKIMYFKKENDLNFSIYFFSIVLFIEFHALVYDTLGELMYLEYESLNEIGAKSLYNRGIMSEVTCYSAERALNTL